MAFTVDREIFLYYINFVIYFSYLQQVVNIARCAREVYENYLTTKISRSTVLHFMQNKVQRHQPPNEQAKRARSLYVKVYAACSVSITSKVLCQPFIVGLVLASRDGVTRTLHMQARTYVYGIPFTHCDVTILISHCYVVAK